MPRSSSRPSSPRSSAPTPGRGPATGSCRRGRSSPTSWAARSTTARSSRRSTSAPRRLIETAVATLATDRALLLLGLPGTAKTWVSEHLAAAISGDSTLARAGHGRHGRRGRALRLELRPPAGRGSQQRRARAVAGLCARWTAAAIVRIEELTRMPSDVQDALITVLSEKSLPVPELSTEVLARPRLQPHRHRQRPRPRRQRAVQRAPPPLQHRRPARRPRRSRKRCASSRNVSPRWARRCRCPPRSRAGRRDPPGGQRVPRAAQRPERGRPHQVQDAVGHDEHGRGHLASSCRAWRWPSTSATARVTFDDLLDGIEAHGRARPGARRRSSGASTSTRSPRADMATRRLSTPRVRLLGIRHHGPGSARAVHAALRVATARHRAHRRPAEADGDRATSPIDPEMQPPVAMLGYVVDHPERAVFHPFASFSPEWVALTWALDADVPVRFIDLPVHHVLAPAADDPQLQLQPTPIVTRRSIRWPSWPRQRATTTPSDGGRTSSSIASRPTDRSIADAPFDAIGDAMTSLRQYHDPTAKAPTPSSAGARRTCVPASAGAIADGFSAHRGRLRRVARAGPRDAPRRRARPSATRRCIRGLRQGEGRDHVGAVDASPARIGHRATARASPSPGWYHHLFTHAGPDVIARWFAQAAQVLRAADHPASAADVVEATRLGVLARRAARPSARRSGRGRRRGTAVLGDRHRRADAADQQRARRRHADRLGARHHADGAARPQPGRRAEALPAEARGHQPHARARPAQAARSRSFRAAPSPTLLGVPWGAETEGRRSAGTFRETWQIRWEPELEVRLIEASALGTTVAVGGRGGGRRSGRSAPSRSAS